MDATERYFENRANDWVNDAYDESSGLMPIGVQRIDVVRRILQEYDFGNDATACDLGCGDGALCRELSNLGFIVTGVDRSATMVELATSKSNENGCDINYLQGSIEEAAATTDGRKFDVVTSMGVMYYFESDVDFFLPLKNLMKPEGVALISCRNRLFNLFNGSRKYHDELQSADIKLLLEEVASLDTNIGLGDLYQVIGRLHAVTSPKYLESLPQPDNEKKRDLEKIIGTVEGRQHLPSELSRSAIEAGLDVKSIYGVQPHFLAAGSNDERAAQFLKKLSEALMPLNHLPVSLLWSSHFIVELTQSEK